MTYIYEYIFTRYTEGTFDLQPMQRQAFRKTETLSVVSGYSMNFTFSGIR